MREKKFCPYCAHRLIEKFCEGRNRLFCERCAEPVYENPIPATCLIVTDPADRLLLVKRSVDPKKGFWCLPGGFMEIGETPEECALRELKEETGLVGKIERLFGIHSTSGTIYHTVTLMSFIVKEYSGNLMPGDDASDIGYFHPETLPDIAFESHIHFIRNYYQELRS